MPLNRCRSIRPSSTRPSTDLILLLLLSAYFPLRRRDGEVMGLLMVTYPITRFLIEYLRNDEGAFFAGLTISQNISVAPAPGWSCCTGPGSAGCPRICTAITMHRSRHGLMPAAAAVCVVDLRPS